MKNSSCLINISKIFEVYFVTALSNKFCKVMDYLLSNKEKNSCKYLYKFKSLIIFEWYKNNNITLFVYRIIIYRKELQHKYNIRNNITLLNTMNNLILEALYKNNYVTQNDIYSHKLELYSTFQRWIIFCKYFKVYNGLIIIEFLQLKNYRKLQQVINNLKSKFYKWIL